LCKIVPRAILSVLSWREMERLVCGGAVDLALLKENTEYGPFLLPRIRFKNVLHSFFLPAQRDAAHPIAAFGCSGE
jgi:hypothetical protein